MHGTDIQRFSDLYTAPGKNQTIFQAKHDAFAYVEGKAKEGKITWTTVSNGPFFDWGLAHEFLGFGAFVLNDECDVD